jgi:tRNA-dihydrouridine synthase B
MAALDLDRFFASRPVILAPMEDVSDAVFRAVCRAQGAQLCMTEFVRAESAVAGCRIAARKLTLPAGDTPTAIQIYGADPARLAEAAELAERAEPAFIDVNCGCWVPRVARGGAGAGWLRDPAAMVAMARMVVERVALPVTVKTRIGLGTEERMPIVDLARRLEDVGVRAITLHCRTAKMGHSGEADWSWAARVREVVSIPVIVNGDIRSANDAKRALDETGCAGVMIGRRAIDHPWIFAEVRSRLDHKGKLPPPTLEARFALCREHLLAMSADRGERRAVRAMRRSYPGYLHGIEDRDELIRELNAMPTLEDTLNALERGYQERREAAAA